MGIPVMRMTGVAAILGTWRMILSIWTPSSFAIPMSAITRSGRSDWIYSMPSKPESAVNA